MGCTFPRYVFRICKTGATEKRNWWGEGEEEKKLLLFSSLPTLSHYIFPRPKHVLVLIQGSLSNHDDDGNKNPTNLHIWQYFARQIFDFVFLCPKRWFQFNSRTVRTHFSSIMTLNNWKMIAETPSYIFRWRSRFRRRCVCLSSRNERHNFKHYQGSQNAAQASLEESPAFHATRSILLHASTSTKWF